jgi:hypothetical protein
MDNDLREMIEENNELLKEAVELSRENHKRIKAIRANIRRGFWVRVAYWALLILIAAGAFYAIKPTVDRLLVQYNSISTQINNTNEFLQNPGQLIERSITPTGVAGLGELNSISDIADPTFLQRLFLGSEGEVSQE